MFQTYPSVPSSSDQNTISVTGRPPPRRGPRSLSDGEKVGDQGNQHHADQHDASACHKLYHGELVVKGFYTKNKKVYGVQFRRQSYELEGRS